MPGDDEDRYSAAFRRDRRHRRRDLEGDVRDRAGETRDRVAHLRDVGAEQLVAASHTSAADLDAAALARSEARRDRNRASEDRHAAAQDRAEARANWAPGAEVSGSRVDIDQATVRVFLVDAHEALRRGVEAIVHNQDAMVVVGEASTVAQGRARIAATHPDVVLLGLRLPDGSGMDLCRELKVTAPTVRCLVFTAFHEEVDVLGAVEAGAAGFLTKQARSADLVQAIRTIARGGSVIDPKLTEIVAARVRGLSTATSPSQARLSTLSERQREVLSMIALGQTNRQIAEEISLTEKAVKNIATGLFATLDVTNRIQAARFVLVPTDPTPGL